MIESINQFLAGHLVNLIYWGMAIFGTAVFMVQLVLMLIFGHSDDYDVSTDHSGADFAFVKLFSIRSVIAFIAFFGWGGVIWGSNGWLGFAAAFATGFIVMLLVSMLVMFLMRLQKEGNINSADYIGCTGKVYMKIPAGRIAAGKVTVSIRNCTREIQALADMEILSGESVKIEKHIDSQKFLVSKI